MGNGARSGRAALLLVAIFLLALNMRGTITGVGPLVPEMSQTTGYSEVVLGVLLSIPMFTWAIGSPFVHAATVRWGLDRVLLWALVGLGVATILRSIALPGEAGLWIGTVLIGFSLAIANVLMPVATRRDFGPRASAVMGVNTNMLVIWAAAMSGLAVPISMIPIGDGTLGWRGALLFTAVLLPFAIVFWIVAHRRGAALPHTAADEVPTAPPGVGKRVWTDRLAWLIAWYMGLQSIQFFIISSWLPKVETARGVDPAIGGVEVMLMQLAGMVATMCLPLLRRTVLAGRLPGTIVIPGVLAAFGLVLFPDLTMLWVLILGVASGPCLAIPLVLITERSRDGATATAVSGMVQGFGYALSGFGPIVFGWLHGLAGSWQTPMWFYVAVMVALMIVGYLIRPGRHVFDPPSHAAAPVRADAAVE